MTGFEVGVGVATRISVSCKGPLGLDDPDRMRADLEAATGLAWRADEVHRENVLVGGIVELVFMAVIGKTTEMAVEAVLERVKRTVEEIRSRRLDPPEPMTVTVEDGIEDQIEDDIRDAVPESAVLESAVLESTAAPEQRESGN